MAFSTSIEEKNGVGIIRIHGRLILGDATRQVRDTVKGLVAQGQTKILFDVGDVDYIDSAGLGTLVACHSSVRNGGGQLKLLHVGQKLHEQLAITKLVTVFDNFEDEALAVASFGAAAQA
jgi:anti-sigma B factor antagonist